MMRITTRIALMVVRAGRQLACCVGRTDPTLGTCWLSRAA